MYCKTCGNLNLGSYKFCANCGERVSFVEVPPAPEVPPVTEPFSVPEPVVVQEPFAPEVFPVSEPFIAEEDIPFPEPPEPMVSEYYGQSQIEEPQVSESPQPQQPKEKYFFGKAALMFCLTIIAILSVTTGMFIGLYVNEFNKKAAPASTDGNMSIEP